MAKLLLLLHLMLHLSIFAFAEGPFEKVQPVFETYCMSCHQENASAGRLLWHIEGVANENAEAICKTVFKSPSMPPPYLEMGLDEDPEAKELLLNWLNSVLDKNCLSD